MIRANCRDKFTHDDFEFIVSSLTKDRNNRIALTDLLTDQEMRDDILDDDILFCSVTQKQGVSKISPYLYFYLLTRKVFLENKIDDRNLTDYVACMLAEFCATSRVNTISPGHPKKYSYLTDMMNDFMNASSFEAFLIRSHLGNYALFLTGLFPDAIYRKSTYGRKAPGFDYYEKMGSSSYQWASQHKLALKYRLVEILSELAERFRHIRLALNSLTDNYISLDDRPESLDKMLRQLFFGGSNFKNFEA